MVTQKSMRAIKAKEMGFNVKLKKMEVIQDPHIRMTSNNRKQIVGHGSDGTPIFKFIAS